MRQVVIKRVGPDYANADATSRVQIIPTPGAITHAPSGATIIAGNGVTKTLVSGSTTVMLPVNDDPDLDPHYDPAVAGSSWTYEVRETVNGSTRPPWFFTLPTADLTPLVLLGPAGVPPSAGYVQPEVSQAEFAALAARVAALEE